MVSILYTLHRTFMIYMQMKVTYIYINLDIEMPSYIFFNFR